MTDLIFVSEILPRNEKINAAIQDFIALAHAGYNIDSDDVQENVWFYNDIDTLTVAEKQYIAAEVRRHIY